MPLSANLQCINAKENAHNNAYDNIITYTHGVLDHTGNAKALERCIICSLSLEVNRSMFNGPVSALESFIGTHKVTSAMNSHPYHQIST